MKFEPHNQCCGCLVRDFEKVSSLPVFIFTSLNPVPNVQVCYFKQCLVHVLVFFSKTFIFFIFIIFMCFLFFIIIVLYNKNKVFLFHFCIFVSLDASLKFGERRHTPLFFK